MSSIDERIVDMRFNNGEFEKGIKESMKSLEDLKKALELDKQTQSLNNLEKAVSSMNFQQLSNNVEQLTNRFSNLGIVGMTALQNIANKITDTVMATAKSLTLSQIFEGKGKYEQKLESVQAIKAATGQSVEEIEKVFDKLTEYTDWTSYSFSNMATTIGQFVSKGIDLDTAEMALEGIGNAAADAGASIQNANVAMYNFAQAIAAGKMTHMDWISINKTAHMGTKKFEEVVIDTAIDLGKLQKVEEHVGKTTKGTVVDFLSFDQTLKEGWYDTDVIIESLLRFADTSTELGAAAFDAASVTYSLSYAMSTIKDTISSGWMKSFQLIFGNLDEASDLFSAFTDMVTENLSAVSDWRNEILESWRDFGGREYLFEGILNILQTIFDICRGIGMAFQNIFPEDLGAVLAEASEGFYNFSVAFKETFGITDLLYSTAMQTGAQITPQIQGATAAVEDLSEAFELLNGNISYGEQSERVKAMQKLLMKAGYSLDKHGADGIYGPETRAALTKFQEDMGLVVDGIFGPKSKQAMQDFLSVAKGVQETTEEEPMYYTMLGSSLKKLQDIAQAVFAVFRIGWKVLSFGVGVAGRIVSALAPIGNMLLTVGAVISDFITAFEVFINDSGIFETALAGLDLFLSPIRGMLENAAWAFDEFFATVEDGAFDAFAVAGDAINMVFGEIFQFLPAIKAMYKALFEGTWYNYGKGNEWIEPVLKSLLQFRHAIVDTVDAIKTFFRSIDYNSVGNSALGVLTSALSAAGVAVNFLIGAVQKASGTVSKWFTELKNSVANLLPESFSKNVKSFEKLMNTVSGFKKGKGIVTAFKILSAEAEKVKDTVKSSLKFDEVKDDVAWMQQALVDAGFATKDFIVDGIYGPKTKEAIESFQKKMGLAVDGVFGPETFKAFQTYISGQDNSSYLENISASLDVVKGKIQDFIDAFNGDFSPENVYNTVSNWVRQIWNGFTTAVSEFFTGKQIARTNAGTSLLTAIEEGVMDSEDNESFTDQVREWVLGKLGAIVSAIKQAFQSIGLFGSNLYETVKNWIGEIWSGIIDGIKEFIFGKEPDKMIDRVELADAGMSDLGLGAFFSSPKEDPTLREKVKNWISAKLTQIGETIRNFLSGAYDTVMGWIPEKWKNIFGALYSALFQGSYDKSNEDLSGITGFLDKLIAIHDFIINKIKPIIDPIVDFCKSVGSILWDAILTLIDPSHENPRWSWEGKKDGKGNPIYTVEDRLKGFAYIWEKIKGTLSGMFGKIDLKWIGKTLSAAMHHLPFILSSLLFLFIEFGAGKLLNALSNFVNSANSKWEPATTKLMKIAGSIALIAAVVYVLGNMNTWQLLQGLAAITVIGLVFGALNKIGATKLKGVKSFGGSMLKMAGAIAILALLAGLMKFISWPTLLEGLLKVAVVMTVMVLAIRAISRATKGSSVKLKGLTSFIGAVALLAGLAVLMKYVSWKTLIVGLLKVSAVMLVMSTFVKRLAKTGKIGMKSLSLLGVVAAISTLALLATIVAKMNTGQFYKGLLRLWAISKIIGSVMKSLSKGISGASGVGSVKGAVGANAVNMFVGLAGIFALMKMMEEIGNMNTGSWMKGIAGLGTLALAMKALAKAVYVFGAMGWTGGLKAGVNVAFFTGTLTAFGYLAGLVDEWLDGGLSKTLKRGGVALGEGIGGLIQGIKDGLKTADDEDQVVEEAEEKKTFVEKINDFLLELQGLSSELVTTWESLQPFFDKVKTFDSDTAEGFQNLALAGGALTAEGFFDWVTSKITGTSGGLMYFLQTLQKAVPEVEALGKMTLAPGTTEGIQSLIEPFKALGEIGKIKGLLDLFSFAYELGNIVTDALGDGTMGEEVVDMGPGQMPILKAEPIEDADNFTKFIQSLIRVSPKLDELDAAGRTLKGDYSGIEKFAAPLTALNGLMGTTLGLTWGQFLVSLGDWISFWNEESNVLTYINNLTDTVVPIRALFAAIQETNEDYTWNGGPNDGLRVKLPTMENVNAEDIDKLQPIFESLGSLAKSIKTVVGEKAGIDWASALNFFSDNGLKDFITDIVDVAPDLNSLKGKFKSLDETVVEQVGMAATIISGLGVAAANIPGEGGLFGKIFGEKDASEFGKDMVSLGTSLLVFSKAAKALEGFTFDETAGAGQLITWLSEFEKTLESHGGLSAYFGGEKDLGEFGTHLGLLGEQIASFNTNVGGVNVANFATFASALESLARAESSVMVQSPVEAYENLERFIQLLADGIIDKQGAGRAASLADNLTTIGEAFATGLQEVMSSTSLVENGITIGTELMASVGLGAWEARDTLTQALANAIQSAIEAANVAQMFTDSDLFADMTLTPVIDMSKLQNGISGSQSLLTATPGFTMSGPQISNTVQVVKDNSDVVRAIGSLSAKITNLTSSTVNAISNMKVVVNTGALVGQIAPTVDTRLGSMAEVRMRNGTVVGPG